MNKKILVLGCQGMAGHVIYQCLKKMNNGPTYGTARKSVVEDSDVWPLELTPSGFDGLKNILSYLRPEIVINCIGTLVKSAEANPPEAVFCNTYTPRWLEHYCKNSATKIIHLSTDCVFSGNRRVWDGLNNFHENAVPDPKDVYGRTKHLGEIVNNKDLTIRTSIIGPELKSNGTGLLHWFLTNEQFSINGFLNAKWTGVTTVRLARQLPEFIENNVTGLYHFVPVAIDKYHLLCEMRNVFKVDREIHAVTEPFIDKTLVDSRRLVTPGILSSSSPYTSMLQETLDWIKENQALYPHYRSILS